MEKTTGRLPHGAARSSEDYRDDLVRVLCFSEAELLERVVDLSTERDAYQLLVKQALEALHTVTIERDILRGQIQLDRRRERRERQVAA